MQFLVVWWLLCTGALVYGAFIDNSGKLVVNFHNIRQLACLSSNAYLVPGSPDYIETEFGLVRDISLDNHTVKAVLFNNGDVNVIAIKGTTVWTQAFNEHKCPASGYSDPVTPKGRRAGDKYNDNLLFTCCLTCRECPCTCRECYKRQENNYVFILKTIVDSLSEMERKRVIFTGHSLGGALSSIVAGMYNKIAVAFSSPGDARYIEMAEIRHNQDQVYHFGHDADPIFTGRCGTTCNLFGYNIETRCHRGYTCEYPAKKKLGIRESIWNHKMQYIINNILVHWEDDFPECKRTECTECESCHVCTI